MVQRMSMDGVRQSSVQMLFYRYRWLLHVLVLLKKASPYTAIWHILLANQRTNLFFQYLR
jgi:hypothetical protein